MVELPDKNGVWKEYVDTHDMRKQIPTRFFAITQFLDSTTRADQSEIISPGIECRQVVVENGANGCRDEVRRNDRTQETCRLLVSSSSDGELCRYRNNGMIRGYRLIIQMTIRPASRAGLT